MRGVATWLAAGLFVTWVSQALAQPAPADSPWVRLGVTLGYGWPLGAYAQDVELNGSSYAYLHDIDQDAYGAVPIGLEFGAWLSRRLLLGVYGQYAIGILRAADPDRPLDGGCPQDADCWGAGWRFGLHGRYVLLDRSGVRPFVGLGLGYERIGSRVKAELALGTLDQSMTFAGPELAQLQAGVDFRIGSSMHCGPMATVSLAEYTSCSAKFGEDEQRCELIEGSLHSWLALSLGTSVEF